MKEHEITGPVARKMRTERGMTQKEFWGPAGVQQSVSARYEAGGNVPRAVRLLIVSLYCGTKPQTSPHANALNKARRALDAATKGITEARAALGEI